MTGLSIFKKCLWITLLIMVQTGLSHACDGLTSDQEPKILKVSVAGAHEFAKKMEEWLQKHSNSLLVTDGDGVYTRVSIPQEGKIELCPRGDMPAYFSYLHEDRNLPMILASAWNKPLETFKRVNLHHLGPTFDMQQTHEEGIRQLDSESYHFFRNGNVISIRRKPLFLQPSAYFRQKAFAPWIIFGKNYSCDQVIFIDDGIGNRDLFEKEIGTIPLYSTVKRIVIVAIPEIYGQTLETDIIPEPYLPAAYKQKWDASLAPQKLQLLEEKSVPPESSVLKSSLGACSLEANLEEIAIAPLKSSRDGTIVEGKSSSKLKKRFCLKVSLVKTF